MAMKRITLIILGIAIATLGSWARGTDKTSENNAVLARNMFIEASKMKSLGNIDSYYQLIAGAYSLNPSDESIAFRYGEMLINSDKYTQMENAGEVIYNLMLPYAKAHPDDYNEANVFARVCLAFDRTEEAMAVFKHLSEVYPRKLDSIYFLAQLYAKQGETQKAIEIYDRLGKEPDLGFRMATLKAQTYLQSGDTTALINEGRKLLAEAPKNVEYNNFMSDVFDAIGMTDSAICYLDRAAEIDPEDGNVYMRKARIYYNQGDSSKYDDNIYQAITCANLDVETKISVLDVAVHNLLRENDSIADDRVVKFFDTLIEQHPHESEIHRRYSRYLATINDYKGAVEQLQYALDTDPGNADDWSKVMILSIMNKDEQRAAEAAEKSLEYNPGNIDLYQYIPSIYLQMKQYDKAVEVIDRAIAMVDSTQSNPSPQLLSSLYCSRGDALVQKGDTTAGFDCYERALEIMPANTLALNNYAYFLAVKGVELDKAERLSALAVRNSPDNSSNLDTYAWIYFKKRDYSLARFYIEKAMECAKAENSFSAEIYDHYGDILFMSGEPDAAVENWEKALKLRPDDELIAKKVEFKTYFYK